MKLTIHLKTFIYSTIITCSFYSCRKDKEVIEVNNPNTNTFSSPISPYTQLKTGNYWIYQYYNYDSLGVAVPEPAYDSIYVEKDTVVNGLTYHKYCTAFFSNDTIIPNYDYSLLRDSANFTLGSPGFIYFTSSPLYDTLQYNVYTNGQDTTIDFTELTDRDSLMTVPAGTFSVINRKRTETVSDNLPDVDAIYIHSFNFAENIGMVLFRFKVTSDNQIFVPNDLYEKRLIRYHVIH
jgi:hypothetical protein